MKEQAPIRPYRLLRGLLTMWLASWAAIICLFIYAQLDAQPLFRWPVAAIWLAIMGAGWLFVFFLLRRLQKAPPE